jgi:hypothetical protein
LRSIAVEIDVRGMRLASVVVSIGSQLSSANPVVIHGNAAPAYETPELARHPGKRAHWKIEEHRQTHTCPILRAKHLGL